MEKVVIIGSGIAGISCLEEIYHLQEIGYKQDSVHVTLVTNSTDIIRANIIEQITPKVEEIEVEQTDKKTLQLLFPQLKIVHAKVVEIDPEAMEVKCEDSIALPYNHLCLATGARPHLLLEKNPLVIGIRDTESVENLMKRLGSSRRVLVVGNGGVALELVEAIDSADVVWVIKHGYIGNTFLDGSASSFILPEVSKIRQSVQSSSAEGDSKGYIETSFPQNGRPRLPTSTHSAVGPDWKKNFVTKSSTSHSQNHSLLLEFNVEAQAVMARGAKASWLFPSVNDKETELAEIKLEEVTREWPLAVQLTNGKIYGCDLIICAIGVIPNTELVKNFVNLSNSGGIIVDKNLQTPIYKNIYAFGDCSTVQVDSECWFQMRLWSQARMMGRKAAQVIMECAHIEGGLDFEMFSHITHFFGYKVILLGLFNGQKLPLEKEHAIKQMVAICKSHDRVEQSIFQESNGEMCPKVEVLVRETPDVEYIKVIVVDGRVKGAMLIGETGLEDTFENLILNQLDVSTISGHLLDPDIDIEDFFD